MPKFLGIAWVWPGTFGWTDGGWIGHRIFWLGPVGFGFKFKQ